MFTTQQFEGIILGLAKLEIITERDEAAASGYRVKLKINFRSHNERFLLGLQESLTKHGILTNYRAPKLKITGVKNLLYFIELIPELPSACGKFAQFKEMLEMYEEGKHLTQKGLDRIFEIKGLI